MRGRIRYDCGLRELRRWATVIIMCHILSLDGHGRFHLTVGVWANSVTVSGELRRWVMVVIMWHKRLREKTDTVDYSSKCTFVTVYGVVDKGRFGWPRSMLNWRIDLVLALWGCVLMRIGLMDA